MKKDKRDIFYLILEIVFLILWILWVIIFPLFVDTSLVQIGYLGSIPVPNPYYGSALFITAILVYRIMKDTKKYIMGNKNEKEIS